MKKKLLILPILIICLIFVLEFRNYQKPTDISNLSNSNKTYWFMLNRKSNIEFLYHGTPGNTTESNLIKQFKVKSGVPGQSPTPLPELLGRKYWLITHKENSMDNPDTAPFFLRLDVPTDGNWPYGPVPYVECDGQCDWALPGYFGLHGTGGKSEKLAKKDLGSSGCIRHSDKDITYLYNLLNPEKEAIRYYIKDE
jgi:lipoprotein-anchoring transpeptidase ErfK/SrfK